MCIRDRYGPLRIVVISTFHLLADVFARFVVVRNQRVDFLRISERHLSAEDVYKRQLFGSAEHAAAALQAAEESLVLLKHTDGILPLAKGKKLLVPGPNANSMRCLNGGWSYSCLLYTSRCV